MLKHNKNQWRVPGEPITEFFLRHTFFVNWKKSPKKVTLGWTCKHALHSCCPCWSAFAARPCCAVSHGIVWTYLKTCLKKSMLPNTNTKYNALRTTRLNEKKQVYQNFWKQDGVLIAFFMILDLSVCRKGLHI